VPNLLQSFARHRIFPRPQTGPGRPRTRAGPGGAGGEAGPLPGSAGLVADLRMPGFTQGRDTIWWTVFSWPVRLVDLAPGPPEPAGHLDLAALACPEGETVPIGASTQGAQTSGLAP